MKSGSPPRLAAWLLQRHVRGYRAESLAGDLTEEYVRGRSDAWYWAQVLRAVTAAYQRALRLHGPRLLVALAAGWCAVFAGIALLEWAWGFVRHGASAATGALSAQPPEAPYVLHDVTWILLAACIDLAVGRLVVRIYRTHPRFVAGLFAFSILAYRMPVICDQVMAAVTDARLIPLLAQELLATLLWMTCAWLGGLWQRRIDLNSTKR